jgi:hypothetical protein
MSFDDRIASHRAQAQTAADAATREKDEERRRLTSEIAKAQSLLPELAVAARRFVETKRQLGYNPHRLNLPSGLHVINTMSDAEIGRLPIGYYGPTDPIPWRTDGGGVIEILFNGEFCRPSMDSFARDAALGYTTCGDRKVLTVGRFATILDGFAKAIVHLESAGLATPATNGLNRHMVALPVAERWGKPRYGWFRSR